MELGVLKTFGNILKKLFDFPQSLVQDISTMNNEIVTYEVQLDHPDFYVEFQAPDGLTENEILNFAIEEMTRKTEIWSVKIKKKG